MKKNFILLSGAFFVLAFTSCSGKKEGGMSDKAKKNLDAVHAVSDAFKSGDISGIDAIVAADFVDHSDRGDLNRDSLKAMIKVMHEKNTDMKSDVEKEFADDDYAFVLYRYTGNSDGSMGMPKGAYDMKSIQVVRFKDGKAVEHWEYMEPREMMKMMPPPSMGNKTDSTHM